MTSLTSRLPVAGHQLHTHLPLHLQQSRPQQNCVFSGLTVPAKYHNRQQIPVQNDSSHNNKFNGQTQLPIARSNQENGASPLRTQSDSKRSATNACANAGTACDLCRKGSALVSCQDCDQSFFCAACDRMYHRHLERRVHVRTSLSPAVGKTGIAKPLPVTSGPKPMTLSSTTGSQGSRTGIRVPSTTGQVTGCTSTGIASATSGKVANRPSIGGIPVPPPRVRKRSFRSLILPNGTAAGAGTSSSSPSPAETHSSPVSAVAAQKERTHESSTCTPAPGDNHHFRDGDDSRDKVLHLRPQQTSAATEEKIEGSPVLYHTVTVTAVCESSANGGQKENKVNGRSLHRWPPHNHHLQPPQRRLSVPTSTTATVASSSNNHPHPSHNGMALSGADCERIPHKSKATFLQQLAPPVGDRQEPRRSMTTTATVHRTFRTSLMPSQQSPRRSLQPPNVRMTRGSPQFHSSTEKRTEPLSQKSMTPVPCPSAPEGFKTGVESCSSPPVQDPESPSPALMSEFPILRPLPNLRIPEVPPLPPPLPSPPTAISPILVSRRSSATDLVSATSRLYGSAEQLSRILQSSPHHSCHQAPAADPHSGSSGSSDHTACVSIRNGSSKRCGNRHCRTLSHNEVDEKDEDYSNKTESEGRQVMTASPAPTVVSLHSVRDLRRGRSASVQVRQRINSLDDLISRPAATGGTARRRSRLSQGLPMPQSPSCTSSSLSDNSGCKDAHDSKCGLMTHSPMSSSVASATLCICGIPPPPPPLQFTRYFHQQQQMSMRQQQQSPPEHRFPSQEQQRPASFDVYQKVGEVMLRQRPTSASGIRVFASPTPPPPHRPPTLSSPPVPPMSPSPSPRRGCETGTYGRDGGEGGTVPVVGHNDIRRIQPLSRGSTPQRKISSSGLPAMVRQVQVPATLPVQKSRLAPPKTIQRPGFLKRTVAASAFT